MQTVIHEYYFQTDNANEKAEYEALRKKLTAMGLKCFETWGGGGSHYHGPKMDGAVLTLETAHLFSDQWNTAPIEGVSEMGMRVFDWAQDYPIDFSKKVKRGHWLEQTEEMREIRQNTLTCGYCGKYEPAASGKKFCGKCLENEYLKASDLHLTRLLPVATTRATREPLTEEERAELMPQYVKAQTVGNSERGKARLAKFRADLEAKYEKETTNAKVEHDGFLWLLDHGLTTATVQNCIYYNHTQKFSFGWRQPVEGEILSAILEIVSEFPYPYEIKCADGRTLSHL
jgi:hypothetical protein